MTIWERINLRRLERVVRRVQAMRTAADDNRRVEFAMAATPALAVEPDPAEVYQPGGFVAACARPEEDLVDEVRARLSEPVIPLESLSTRLRAAHDLQVLEDRNRELIEELATAEALLVRWLQRPDATSLTGTLPAALIDDTRRALRMETEVGRPEVDRPDPSRSTRWGPA